MRAFLFKELTSLQINLSQYPTSIHFPNLNPTSRKFAHLLKPAISCNAMLAGFGNAIPPIRQCILLFFASSTNRKYSFIDLIGIYFSIFKCDNCILDIIIIYLTDGLRVGIFNFSYQLKIFY